MGGLGPGIGGLEILVIGLVALLVVGPKDLPLMMRKVGKAMAKARAMANEFRASFDELARQSELDELRKEVEALRTGQGLVPLGKEAEQAFGDIKTSLNQPLLPPSQPASSSDVEPVMDAGEFSEPPAVETPPEEPETQTKPAKANARKSASAASATQAPRIARAPKKRVNKVDL